MHISRGTVFCISAVAGAIIGIAPELVILLLLGGIIFFVLLWRFQIGIAILFGMSFGFFCGWFARPPTISTPKCIEGYIVRAPQFEGGKWNVPLQTFQGVISLHGLGEAPKFNFKIKGCGVWEHTRFEPWRPARPKGSLKINTWEIISPFPTLRGVIWNWANSVDIWMRERVQKIVPYPASGFLQGIVWAGRNGLGKEWEEDFRRTGLAHLTAVSGFNVSLLATFAEKIFQNVNPISRLGILIPGALFFSFLAGAGAPVIRASLSSLMQWTFSSFGFQVHPLRCLWWIAAVMACSAPAVARYDIGFHLSFLATWGIITLGEKWEKILSFVPEKWEMRTSLVQTMSASTLVIPYATLKFQTISIIAPFANLVLGWSIPLLMAGTMCAILLSDIPGSSFILAPITIGANFFLEMVHIFSMVPFASYSWK